MKSSTVPHVILLLIACVVLSSCKTIGFRLIGFRTPKALEEEKILSVGNRFNIPSEDVYQLDSSYLNYITWVDSTKSEAVAKNHYQPLQALYYNQGGELISFHINCYAGGMMFIDWNRDDIMEVYPPKQQAPLDTLFCRDTVLAMLQPLSTTNEFEAYRNEEVVVVFWTKFMTRQSRRLIRFVQNNAALAEDREVKIIYVNMDNFFMSMDAEIETED